MAAANQPVIIVRRKGGGGHDDGHGSAAWKIAYADFVTAMMAFFLLLWLLNSVTEEQMVGISNYFAPTTVSYSKSGSGGVLGGTTMANDGGMQAMQANMGLEPGVASQSGEDQPDPVAVEIEEAGQDPELREQLRELDQIRLEQAAEDLRQAFAAKPELKELSQHLLIDLTDEGLRLQIVDLAGESMFERGSAQLSSRAAKLLREVAGAIAFLPNDVKIAGHTDATPYPSTSGYSNWELSSDRAHASRRALVAAGITEANVKEVTGVADSEPLDPADPFAARNRRISVVLKYLAVPSAGAEASAGAAGGSGARQP